MRLTPLPLLCILACAAAAEPHVLPAWALGPFVRPEGVNPVIAPQATLFECPVSRKQVAWESNDTFNPAAIVKDGSIYVLYRAEDTFGKGIGSRTSRIGLAESRDGIHFTRRPEPVLFPGEDDQKGNEWPGGCEDPRIVEREDGTYVLAYTQWNRQVPRLAIATSRDLVHWTKHGPAFAHAHGGRFKDRASKSGSILTRLVDGRLIAAKIDGKYVMFGGESPAYLCTSDDAIAWTPVLNDRNELTISFAPRRGTFFSLLTEPGPPALLTDQGIVLMYNGKNANGTNGDRRFNAGVYAAGQVLIDAQDPSRALDWLKAPFFRPMLPYEASGQYAAGTVFIEGLVHFQKKWFLYYGCADSRVSVAVWDPARPGQADPLPEAPTAQAPKVPARGVAGVERVQDWKDLQHQPSATDAAQGATVTVVNGGPELAGISPKAGAGALARLTDGGSAGADDPAHCAWCDGGEARLLMDLGRPLRLASIHSFSRHTGDRAVQRYTLWSWSKDGAPSGAGDPVAAGWTLLGHVDTSSAGEGGIHCSTIAPAVGPDLGSTRYLLWIQDPLQTDGTFWTEFDVDEAGKP